MAKKSKKKEVDLKAEIKKMEEAKRKAVTPIKVDMMVTFNSWHHMRKHAIPKHHMKEILQADFTARGIGAKATVAEYDKALKLYGIEL